MGRTAEEPRPRDGRLGEPTRMAACISRDQIGKAPLESAHHSPVGRMTGDSDFPGSPPDHRARPGGVRDGRSARRKNWSESHLSEPHRLRNRRWPFLGFPCRRRMSGWYPSLLNASRQAVTPSVGEPGRDWTGKPDLRLTARPARRRQLSNNRSRWSSADRCGGGSCTAARCAPRMSSSEAVVWRRW
jgi:hypothetical protein